VLACKSELQQQVDPQDALKVLKQYDVRLVEVALSQDAGKDRIKRAFSWLLQAVRDRCVWVA